MTTDARSPVVGVGVLAVEDGRILLVKRSKDPGKGLWAVPGGKVAFGEAMRAAAVREVMEETGLRVELGDVIWTGETIGTDHHIVLIDFLATSTVGELAADDDADEAEWVAFEDLDSYQLTPTMYDLIQKVRNEL
jgi:8-oxo-dGTP diphosphatase